MKRIISLCFVAALVFFAFAARASQDNPVVVIETNKGMIMAMLDAEKAPKSVENFLTYVDAGFYDGTVFHRVIKDFMVQGGGFDMDMRKKPTNKPIANEAGNGLKNKRGTLAMARTNVVVSATSQFFINTKDNSFLDHNNETPRGFGYAVFGRVIRGMDVVDKIEGVKTDRKGMMQDVPVEPVVIEKISRYVDKAAESAKPKSDKMKKSAE